MPLLAPRPLTYSETEADVLATNGAPRTPDNSAALYSKARTAGGLVLLGVVALIAILDAIRVDFSADNVQLGLLLGSGLLLLGVEAGKRFIR